jgi:hypothetical protein
MYEYEYEFEALPEWEGEFEYEGEWEGEFEGEEFFRRLANMARTQWGTRRSPLRRVALGAARAALTGGGGALGRVIGGGPGSALGASLGGALSGLLPDPEFEFEGEFEEELNPIRRVYPDALMEHLGHAAATAQNEAEAEAFIGALIPLAARIAPRVAPAIMRVAPRLVRGAANVTRTLRRSPATRPLVRTLPSIVRRTAASLAQQAGRGQPVTPQSAVQALAQQTARVIGSPQQAVQAYRQSRIGDQQYHQTMSDGLPGPGMGANGAACATCGAAAGGMQ